MLNRPIAKGLLSKKIAAYYASLLAIEAMLLGYLSGNFPSFIVLFVTLVGVSLYSPLSKNLPISKVFVVALLVLAPTIYAISLTRLHLPAYILVGGFVFIVGRELLLDTRDFDKDLLSGKKTIVAYLGIPTSRAVAWLLMFAGVIYFLLNFSNIYGALFVILGLIGLIFSFYLDIHNKVKYGGFTIITMILCLLAIPFGLQ